MDEALLAYLRTKQLAEAKAVWQERQNPHCRTVWGATPLHLLCDSTIYDDKKHDQERSELFASDSTEFLSVLLRAGADPEKCNARGETPLDVDFTWFGVYDVRLRKDGYEPLVTTAEAKAPLHEQPGIDLAAMAVPGTKRTRIEWNFVLEPSEGKAEGLLDRAKEFRNVLCRDTDVVRGRRTRATIGLRHGEAQMPDRLALRFILRTDRVAHDADVRRAERRAHAGADDRRRHSPA